MVTNNDLRNRAISTINDNLEFAEKKLQEQSCNYNVLRNHLESIDGMCLMAYYLDLLNTEEWKVYVNKISNLATRAIETLRQ